MKSTRSFRGVANDHQIIRARRARDARQRLARAVASTAARIETLECRRMLAVAINGTVTLDETAGLQTSGVAVTGEDNNDNDVLLSQLPAAFSSRLFGSPTAGLGLSNAFPTLIGVGKSADGYISVSANGAVTSLGFTKPDGSALPVLGGAAPGVASGLSAVTGGAITLFADSSLGNRMVVGVDAAGDKVLAMFLDPVAGLTSAKVWTVQFEPLSNPVATNPDDPLTLSGLGVAAGVSTEFNFNALPSGSNLFGTVGDTASAIVVIGKTPVLQADGTGTNTSDVIHTSQGGGPTTIGVNNQMFDPGDGAYFTFVKDPDPNYLAGAPNGLSSTEADDADNIVYKKRLEALGGFVKIAQIQGNSLATMKITLFNGGDSDAVDFNDDQRVLTSTGRGEGPKATITKITVYNANGAIVQTINNPTKDANGAVTVSGLNANYKVAWETNDLNDQVLIQGVVGKFDIGGFGIDQPSTDVAPLSGVRFEDDGPSITASIVNAPTLTVDETVLTTDATGGFAAQFTPVFGSDGAGATPVSYALSTPGGNSGLTDTATGQAVVLSLASGVVEGRTVTSNDLVFTVSVNASGQVTLDQKRAVVHADTTNPNDSRSLSSAGLVVLTATVNDKDGDSASTPLNIGLQLIFRDDGPSITASATGAPTLTVDESVLATNAQGAFAAQFTPSFGADGQGATPVSYTLSTPGGNSGLVDTATGQAVMLSLVGGVVQGRTATSNELVFTVSVNASGNVTLDQLRSIVHPTTNPDESKTLAAANLVALTATAVDKDGDSGSTPLNIGQLLVFKDDGPTIGPIDDSIVDLLVGATVTKSLNGAVGADGNAAPYTIDSFTASVTINGVELRGVLSANKQVVTYFRDTNNDTVFGNAGDTAFYRLTLSQSGAGTYTFDVLASPPPALLHFDFDELHSGSNLFGTVGDASNSLIVIAEHPKLKANGTLDTAGQAVKTSQGGTGATIGIDSQMIDPGEGAFFTYVNGSDPNFLAANLDQGEADDSAAIKYSGGTNATTSASVTISQTQGPTPGTMTISAFDVAGSPQQKPFVDGISTGTGIGAAVSITSVTIHKANGTTVTENAAGPNTSANISFAGGVATVSGLGSADRIEWTTAAPHDRVLIKGVAGKFDVGAFDITQTAPTPDQQLNFVAKVVDGDGDLSTAGFSIGIDGTGTFDDGIVTLSRSSSASALFGSEPIDELNALLA